LLLERVDIVEAELAELADLVVKLT